MVAVENKWTDKEPLQLLLFTWATLSTDISISTGATLETHITLLNHASHATAYSSC